jgi:hypothetical protein
MAHVQANVEQIQDGNLVRVQSCIMPQIMVMRVTPMN